MNMRLYSSAESNQIDKNKGFTNNHEEQAMFRLKVDILRLPFDMRVEIHATENDARDHTKT